MGISNNSKIVYVNYNKVVLLTNIIDINTSIGMFLIVNVDSLYGIYIYSHTILQLNISTKIFIQVH